MLRAFRSYNIFSVRLGLIVLAAITSFAVGLSTSVYPYAYSPLLIGGLFLALFVISLYLREPCLVLCSTLILLLLPNGLVPASTQSILNRFFTVFTFGIWFIAAIWKSRRITFTPVAIMMLGFLSWSAISILWASRIDISFVIIQVYILRFLLFLFLLPNLIYSEKELRYLMKTLAFSGWLFALISIYGIVTTGYAAGSRLSILDTNSNSLGVILLLSSIGVFWQASSDPSSHPKANTLLSYIYLIVLIFITALSGSRGSAISLGITLSLFLLWKQTRHLGLIGMLIIAVGLLAVPLAFSTTLERFLQPERNSFLGGREVLWPIALQLIRSNPLKGVGIGNSPIVMLSMLKGLTSSMEVGSVSIHNPILVIWAETGLPGLVLYLSVIGSAVLVSLKEYFLNKNQKSTLLQAYFPLAISVFVGYMASWVKGGGMEFDHSFFLMLALLLIPSHLDKQLKCQ